MQIEAGGWDGVTELRLPEPLLGQWQRFHQTHAVLRVLDEKTHKDVTKAHRHLTRHHAQ